MSAINDRIKEASTWRGIVYFLTGLALTQFPEYTAKILPVGFCLSGVIGILFSDKPYVGPTDATTLTTPSKVGLGVLLFLTYLSIASISYSAPFFVIDRDAGANPPTSYLITLPTGQAWTSSTVTPLTSGLYAFKIDMAAAPTGTTNIKVKGCFMDPLWGQLCNVEQTYPLVRPSAPAAISGFTLIP